MNKAILSMILPLALLWTQEGFAQTPPSKDVIIGINDVYVPSETSVLDEAFVVINGMFPNSCYRWKGANVAHTDAYEHHVTPVASVSQGMCLMVLVPFTKEVKLGKLLAGKHTLRFISGDGTYLEKTMTVKE